MTVPVDQSDVSYAGNGVTTAFPTVFRFNNNSECVVKLTLSGGGTLIKTEGVDYTVAGAGLDAGGTVTFLVAPPALSVVLLERTVPFTQATNFRTYGPFSPAVHEAAIDKLTFEAQQLDRRTKALESAGAAGSVVAGNGLAFAGDTLNAQYAAPVAGAVLATNAAASAGALTTLSRSDHIHQVLAAAPVSVTKAANAIGSAATFARSDHKHDITTAVPVAIDFFANAEGTATTLARSDHVHWHGNQIGGGLHALAAGSNAGFISGANATLIGKLPILHDQSFQTVGNVAGGTIIAIGGTEPFPALNQFFVRVVGREVGGAAATYTIGAVYLVSIDVTGACAFVGATQTLWAVGGTAAANIYFAVQSPYLGPGSNMFQIGAIGVVGKTINWHVFVEQIRAL